MFDIFKKSIKERKTLAFQVFQAGGSISGITTYNNVDYKPLLSSVGSADLYKYQIPKEQEAVLPDDSDFLKKLNGLEADQQYVAQSYIKKKKDIIDATNKFGSQYLKTDEGRRKLNDLTNDLLVQTNILTRNLEEHKEHQASFKDKKALGQTAFANGNVFVETPDGRQVKLTREEAKQLIEQGVPLKELNVQQVLTANNEKFINSQHGKLFSTDFTGITNDNEAVKNTLEKFKSDGKFINKIEGVNRTISPINRYFNLLGISSQDASIENNLEALNSKYFNNEENSKQFVQIVDDYNNFVRDNRKWIYREDKKWANDNSEEGIKKREAFDALFKSKTDYLNRIKSNILEDSAAWKNVSQEDKDGFMRVVSNGDIRTLVDKDKTNALIFDNLLKDRDSKIITSRSDKYNFNPLSEEEDRRVRGLGKEKDVPVDEANAHIIEINKNLNTIVNPTNVTINGVVRNVNTIEKEMISPENRNVAEDNITGKDVFLRTNESYVGTKPLVQPNTDFTYNGKKVSNKLKADSFVNGKVMKVEKNTGWVEKDGKIILDLENYLLKNNDELSALNSLVKTSNAELENIKKSKKYQQTSTDEGKQELTKDVEKKLLLNNERLTTTLNKYLDIISQKGDEGVKSIKVGKGEKIVVSHSIVKPNIYIPPTEEEGEKMNKEFEMEILTQDDENYNIAKNTYLTKKYKEYKAADSNNKEDYTTYTSKLKIPNFYKYYTKEMVKNQLSDTYNPKNNANTVIDPTFHQQGGIIFDNTVKKFNFTPITIDDIE